jgi:hypothetical protein
LQGHNQGGQEEKLRKQPRQRAFVIKFSVAPGRPKVQLEEANEDDSCRDKEWYSIATQTSASDDKPKATGDLVQASSKTMVG